MGPKICVLGAGPGGYAAAVRSAQGAAEVTLVEKENPGGTCLNWGGIPSKVMITTAELLEGLLAVTLPDGTRETVAWDRLILATGTRPSMLPGLEFDGVRILSSNDALSLKHVPAAVLIVGGGVIGCEFAHILAAIGAAPTSPS
jgi:pyruvate/2-oxoglutarate dehydrogenase complex dihydrolipoamide dehydrogenase (E3) component